MNGHVFVQVIYWGFVKSVKGINDGWSLRGGGGGHISAVDGGGGRNGDGDIAVG